MREDNAQKSTVSSTAQCNTLGFGCCRDRRCGCGEAGSSRRIVRSRQEGAVGEVEGRGIHLRHRPSPTEASRLHSWDARSNWRDRSTPERRRRRCALTPAEREEISRGLATGDSLRAIAARLGRAVSTVCREVNRNGGRGRYRATEAGEQALKRSRRPRKCLLAVNERLRGMVAQKLQEDCSPQQISGWLSRHYPDEEAMRISHETIYRTLFVQARGALKRELLAHLRSRRMMCRSRHASSAGQPRGQIKEAVSIRERPPEAEDRAEYPVTGKEISWPDRATPTWPPWSSAARGLWCSGASHRQGHRERRRSPQTPDA